MIRLTFIAVWVALAAGAVAAMFHLTFEVEQLKARLHNLNRAIVREQETTHVLQAEWSYLNRPQRLESLSRDLLPGLAPVESGQFVTPARLPKGDANLSPAVDAPLRRRPALSPTPGATGMGGHNDRTDETRTASRAPDARSARGARRRPSNPCRPPEISALRVRLLKQVASVSLLPQPSCLWRSP